MATVEEAYTRHPFRTIPYMCEKFKNEGVAVIFPLIFSHCEVPSYSYPNPAGLY